MIIDKIRKFVGQDEIDKIESIKIPQHLKDSIGEVVQYEINGKTKLYVLSGIRWSTMFKFTGDDGNAYLAV